MGPLKRFSTSLLALSLTCTLLTSMQLAHAHPHLRMAYQLEPMLTKSRVSGLHVSWQMDAQNSALVRENIDLNRNGLLDPDELQAFADSNRALMQPFNYFFTVENGQSGTPLAFEVKQFSARDGGRGFQGGIYLEFEVHLKTDDAVQQLQLQIQDPTWYIGFQPLFGKVLAADTGCDSSFTREKRPTANLGEQEVQRIQIQCVSGDVVRPGAQVSPLHGPINGDNS
ncbi:MAG: hypothetical protein RLZZ470_1128 [Pseudomonadota bacterium]|jgi:ABC-type uncharacterized transport system substrate-binding protein